MDGHRFDEWARSLAAPGSRRRVLAGLVAGALGLAGVREGGAVACRAPGAACRENVNCCSGLCAKDAAGRRVCQCRTVADCPRPDQCHDATCLDGVCGTTVRQGQACNDGSACTTGETCQANGTCGGTAVPCTPQDQCHSAACAPRTGCVQTPLTGTPCNADDSLCTQNDTCQAGTCVPGTPVVCAASDQCHVAGTCDPATGQCSNPAKPDGTACNDGNACTQTDTCQSGVCVGGNPVSCPSGTECVNGGCFDIGSAACTNVCGISCQKCVGSVPGSGNFLCANLTNTFCTSNADCPVGQACGIGARVCITPC
ncbi:MAG TPA: hypothetical protein VH482_27350 [Thermomicrobiales bacterium]|jgi:hypothetical protein